MCLAQTLKVVLQFTISIAHSASDAEVSNSNQMVLICCHDEMAARAGKRI